MLSYPSTHGPVFLIAKVAGRYRSLCGIEQSFIYGLSVVDRGLRLLRIFEAAENRIPIQQELLLAQEKPEAFWSSKPECLTCHGCSFPYIATCLLLGACFDPSDGCLDEARLFSFDKEFDECDKTDAVTIIDISELHNVRYCFVRYNPYNLPVPLMTPLSAATYLFDLYHGLEDVDEESEGCDEDDDEESYEEYDGQDDDEEGGEEDHEDERATENAEDRSRKDATGAMDKAKLLVEGFQGRELVTADSLNSAWPRDGWKGFREENATSSNPGSSNQVRSLRTLAIDKMIRMALMDPEFDVSWISELAGLLEDFLPRLRNWLYEHSDDLELSSVNFEIIIKAFEEAPESRLGVFRKFRLEDLLKIISTLQEKKTLCTLNLSGSKSIDPESLRSILQITPSLKNLYLIGSPSLPLQSVLSLFHESHISVPNLYHSDMFNLFLQHRTERHPGVPSCKDYALSFPTGASTKSPTIQILWVFTCANDLDQYNRKRCGIDWDLFTADVKAKRKFSDLSSYDSPGVNYGRFSLKHGLLSPVRLVTGMSQFAEFSLNNKSWNRSGYKSYSQAAAISFAMAPSTVDGSKFEVGPVPLMIDVDPHCPLAARKRMSPENLFSTIRPGDWSLVILHEHVYYKNFTLEVDPPDLKQKWKYAFVTTRQDSACSAPEDTDLVVADMSTFLAEVAGDEAQELGEYWKQVRANLDGVEPCDEEAVRGLWRGLFLEENKENQAV